MSVKATRFLHGTVPGRRALTSGALIVLVLCVSPRLVSAEFSEPRRVTDGSGGATQSAMGLDAANNVYIASVVRDEIIIKIIGAHLDLDFPLAETGLVQGDPDLATNYGAVTYVSFTQFDESSPEEGREVYLARNTGGPFGLPVNVSHNRVDDFAPKLVLGPTGYPHLAWTQRIGEETRVMVLSWVPGTPMPEPATVASGEYPAIRVDEQDVVHLVYSRDNDIYYNNNRGGGFESEEPVTTTPFEPESSFSVGVDPDGRILIAFECRNSLYFATKSPLDSGFSIRLLDAGGVMDPKMRVRSEGQVTIAHVKEGDVYYVVGQSDLLNLPRKVVLPGAEGSDGGKSHPSLEIDGWNNIHLSYVRDGEVFYTNNTAEPAADFSASPTTGEAPLTVKFKDLSSGDIQVWEWDFGDGSQLSRSRNPTHVYNNPGKYGVSLRVVTAGAKESIRRREDFITVQDASYAMHISNQSVLPNQREVWFPVQATFAEPISAFQIHATYDPNCLTLREARLDFTKTEDTVPEVFELIDDNTHFAVGCIFDVKEFKGDEKIPPGRDQSILNLVFDVPPTAPQGATTKIELVNNPDLSRIINMFTVGPASRLPALYASEVKVLKMEPPLPEFFLRGNADGDIVDRIDISDAIRVLGNLFLGDRPPPCKDAADVNDDGKLDISDPVWLLSYLFLGGDPPAVPFPISGIDPTLDGLGCERP